MAAASTAFVLRVVAQLNERDLLPLVRDVCRAHGVTLEEVCGRLRSRSVCSARHEVWWRVLHHAGRQYTFRDLARVFERDHRTIGSGIRAHKRRLATPSAPERPCE
jgi:chromosomal replication initiation ATPase DnaA